MVRICCTVKNETQKAFLVVSDDTEAWVPKSLIYLDRHLDGSAVLQLPEWLAIKLRMV